MYRIQTQAEAARLVGVEYRFVSLVADIDMLIGELQDIPIEGASAARRGLARAKRQVEESLELIDAGITESVRAYERKTGRDALLQTSDQAAPF